MISVGHELLMGEIVDTNTSYLAQRLVEAGVTMRHASQVGDDLADIVEAFERAHGRSEVVISTGGLGPTSDDLTREAVARVMGEEMRVDPDTLAWLEGVFRQRGMPEMPRTNIKQATLIPSARTIPNPTGTAPGWWVERDGRHIFLLPGPPREIQLMWEGTVGPALAKIAGAGVVVTRTIKTFGVSEGGIDEMLSPLFGQGNPYLGIYARPDGIHLRLIARTPTRAEGETLIAPVEAEIRRTLGAAVWGCDADTPASKAIRLLNEAATTVAAVEGITAGYVAAALSTADTGGTAFAGGFVIGGGPAALPSSFHALTAGHDPETALALARAVRDVTGAGVGIGVTAAEPVSAPGTRSAYHLALVSGGAERVAPGRSMPSREVTMQRGSAQALIELITLLGS